MGEVRDIREKSAERAAMKGDFETAAQTVLDRFVEGKIEWPAMDAELKRLRALGEQKEEQARKAA